jgi:TonB family protein
MRLKAALLILVAFLIVVPTRLGNLMADSFSDHMENAKEFISKGDFNGAITECQKALQKKRHSIEAQSWLGIAYERLGDRLFKNGETDEAIEAYKDALASVPEDAYWHEQLGMALERKGDREAAIKQYQTAAELSPLDDGLRSMYQSHMGGPQGPENAGSLGGGANSVGGGVSEPIPIRKPDPPYTERAREAKLQGRVVLWIVIDGEGKVSTAKVINPLGLGLDANALKTVRAWKFKPAMRNGSPVPVRVKVEITFRLF